MSIPGRAARLATDAARSVGAELLLVGDAAGWALDEQTRQLAANLPSRRTALVSSVPPFTRGRTIHFWNRYPVLEPGVAAGLARRNRVIVTWSHGGAARRVEPELLPVIERMRAAAPAFAAVHVWATIYRDVVAGFGVPRDRIVVLPLGIDLSRFRPGAVERADAKARLGLARDAVCVGSFQRDGERDPKLVKGPDVLVEAAARAMRDHPRLVVLLTGPARGWIQRALADRGVPFRYFGIVPAAEQERYYHACDAYAITAREEGGPLALLESMATGVPVVSTSVGMSLDLVTDGENGVLADVGDAGALGAALSRVLADPALGRRLAARGHETARAYDWRRLGPRYASELYAR